MNLVGSGSKRPGIVKFLAYLNTYGITTLMDCTYILTSGAYSLVIELRGQGLLLNIPSALGTLRGENSQIPGQISINIPRLFPKLVNDSRYLH